MLTTTNTMKKESTRQQPCPFQKLGCDYVAEVDMTDSGEGGMIAALALKIAQHTGRCPFNPDFKKSAEQAFIDEVLGRDKQIDSE
jgi:hypothetical protein